MVSSIYRYAGVAAMLAVASASPLEKRQTSTAPSYVANTNTNCATASDVDYQAVYSYAANDTMDWGFYTQSQGTCDTGSYARVHFIDPSGNDIDCGYVALDGNVNLVSCSNYPRGYMTEGQYTLYWETVPGVNQYSWNQFTISHSQSTVTATTPTQSVTTTPITVVTSTVLTTPTETTLIPQKTITTPSATTINTIKVTPPVTTITTTSTTYYSITNVKYAQTTVTAYTTAACRGGKITNDYTATRGSTTTGSNTTKITRASIADWLKSLFGLRRRDDIPNTVGMVGQPLTTTITPNAVITTITAATSTSVVTTVSTAPAVTITSQNPTPTITVYSGVAVSTTTITLSQSTKSVVKSKLAVTYITLTSTLTYTKNVKTTPVCTPTGK